MDALKRIVGGYLVLMAAVVGLFSVAEPLFHVSTEAAPYSPIWLWIDPFTGLAVLLGVGFAYCRKSAAGAVDANGPVTWGPLVANVLFYGFLGVGLMYFWNWFDLLNEAYNVTGADGSAVAWKVTDVAFPLVSGALGAALLRGDG